jgi:hypothetical protein
MNEMKDYDLIFWCIHDGSRWIGKRIISGFYVVYNPETTEKLKMNTKKLKTLFNSDKANSRVSVKKFKRIAR